MLGYPSLTLTDVTVREVTIDSQGISTVVPGGECLHLETAMYSIPPPADWTCNLAYYSDADCDCGCGQLDPTCPSGDESYCQFCFCDGSTLCNPNEVNPTMNWLCN
jgi:hypothetical protein